jgi:uncharacterized protein (DUF4415 family)
MNTWATTQRIKKKLVTFSVDKDVFEIFKQTANKDMRKYSQIVEGAMRRYVSSKI